jgi:hypothetical protein
MKVYVGRKVELHHSWARQQMEASHQLQALVALSPHPETVRDIPTIGDWVSPRAPAGNQNFISGPLFSYAVLLTFDVQLLA